MNDSAFLVPNASGRHINLLNDDLVTIQHHVITTPSPPISEILDETSTTETSAKRKYHCTEPGCTKSFTTSGHLTRHNRIHTGEKNFPCLFPGCQSKFSRQDNMMQHYRTHMSPKSKRVPKKVIEDAHPRPKLHAHHRIRSSPYVLDRPLTIDQHLNNYKHSLSHQLSDVKYMPSPLIHSKPHQSHRLTQAAVDSPSSSPLQRTPLFSNDNSARGSDEITFYQHQPLSFSKNFTLKQFPFTLLHPSNDYTPTPIPTNSIELDKLSSNENLPDISYDKSASLSQLAHIISTFS